MARVDLSGADQHKTGVSASYTGRCRRATADAPPRRRCRPTPSSPEGVQYWTRPRPRPRRIPAASAEFGVQRARDSVVIAPACWSLVGHCAPVMVDATKQYHCLAFTAPVDGPGKAVFPRCAKAVLDCYAHNEPTKGPWLATREFVPLVFHPLLWRPLRRCDTPTPPSPSGLGRIRWRPGGYLIVSTASPVALPSLRLWVGPELPRLQTPRLSPVAVGKFVEPRPLASNRVLKQAVYPPALWSGAGAAATRTTAKLCCRCAARPGSTVPRPWTTFRRSARINAGEL